MSLNLITKEVADAIIKCRTEEKRTKGKKTLHLANGRKKVRLDKFDLIDGASAFDNVRLTHYGKLVVEIDAETFVKIVKQLLVKELARVEEISTSLQQVKKMVITIVNKFFSVNAGQAVSTVDLAALLVAVDAEKSGDTAVVEAYYKVNGILDHDHARFGRIPFHAVSTAKPKRAPKAVVQGPVASTPAEKVFDGLASFAGNVTDAVEKITAYTARQGERIDQLEAELSKLRAQNQELRQYKEETEPILRILEECADGRVENVHKKARVEHVNNQKSQSVLGAVLGYFWQGS